MQSTAFISLLVLALATSLPLNETELPKMHRPSAAGERPPENGFGFMAKTLRDKESKDADQRHTPYNIVGDKSLKLTLEAKHADMWDNVRKVPCSDGHGCEAVVGGRGSLLGFYGVQFPAAPCYVYVRLASDLQSDFGFLQFYRNVLQHSPIATIIVQGTGRLDRYKTVGGFFDSGFAGLQDLYAIFEYGESREFVAINWIQFVMNNMTITTTTTITPTTTTFTQTTPWHPFGSTTTTERPWPPWTTTRRPAATTTTTIPWTTPRQATTTSRPTTTYSTEPTHSTPNPYPCPV